MTHHKDAVNYEATYIIKPTLDEDSADKVAASVEEYIKGQGGTVISTDKKGRRRLNYEVKKMKDGYYVTTIFSTKGDALSAIKRMMNLSEDIIRSLIVVHEPEAAMEASGASGSSSYR